MLVMLANGVATAAGVQGWYQSLRRPVGTPPDWLFAPVWTVLYVCIGLSAWLVWRRVDVGVERKRAALRRWGWQLLANAAWPPVFFGMHALGAGLVVIALLWAAVAWTAAGFWRVQVGAGLLLLPYLAWVSFASYLNLGFWWLNSG